MGGVRIEIEASGLKPVEGALEALAAADTLQLMTDIGALLESSTRERVEETKTSPDGAAWPANREGTSILLRTGRHLRDSIAYIAAPDQVQVGSSWEFAHVHQFGATIKPKSAKRLAFQLGGRTVFAKKVMIPPRAFVGLSAEDGDVVEQLATDFLGGLVGTTP
jgi:phage gpG-like protein